MSDYKKAEVGVQRTEDGQLINIGVKDGNAFIPFASLRSGDYDEAVAAAAETQPDTKSKG